MKKRLIGVVAAIVLLFAACSRTDNTTDFYRTDTGQICVHVEHWKEKDENWHKLSGGLSVRNLNGTKEYNVNGEYCKVSK